MMIDTHEAMNAKYERIQRAVYAALGYKISKRKASLIYARCGDNPTLSMILAVLNGV